MGRLPEKREQQRRKRIEMCFTREKSRERN
jgi:hypothetical protein